MGVMDRCESDESFAGEGYVVQDVGEDGEGWDREGGNRNNRAEVECRC